MKKNFILIVEGKLGEMARILDFINTTNVFIFFMTLYGQNMYVIFSDQNTPSILI